MRISDWSSDVCSSDLDSFITIAEESGLIVDIGEWVIRTVARTLAQWHAHGMNTRIAVNISPRQLERTDFFRTLDNAMEAANAPWDLLELEITETRSEEHTSELQSLMRISYAVFCLKKQNKT